MGTTEAFQIASFGGPEVMACQSVTLPDLGPRDVKVKHEAIGVNFIDTYHRSGLYPLELPSGIGQEAVGVVEAVGSDVTEFQIGDRVGYCHGPVGSYALERVLTCDVLIPLPDSLNSTVAAGALLKGLTAAYLLRKTFPVQLGHRVLVHAAAGGVGQLLVQWAKHLGATVIGVVGSAAKVAQAQSAGCEHVIVWHQGELASQVKALTHGEGVDVVYDSIGRDTFLDSLDCLVPRGMMVSFGNASGPAPDFSPLTLAQKGSLFFTRPALAHYINDPQEMRDLAVELFNVIESGAVEVRVGQTYPLKEAQQAHEDLEGRKTTGSTVLLP